MFRPNSVTIKFCERLKTSKVELITPLKQAFQNKTLHKTIIRRWHRAFTDDKESGEIEHVSGRMRTVIMDVNINTVLVVIEKDYHSSIQKLANDLRIRKMSIQRILTKDLGMKCVCSMWVPQFLRVEETEYRCSVQGVF